MDTRGTRNLGAEVLKQSRRNRAGENSSEIEDAQAFENAHRRVVVGRQSAAKGKLSGCVRSTPQLRHDVREAVRDDGLARMPAIGHHTASGNIDLAKRRRIGRENQRIEHMRRGHADQAGRLHIDHERLGAPCERPTLSGKGVRVACCGGI